MDRTLVSRKNKRAKLFKDIRADWMLYALLIPGLIYIIIYHYLPMWGVTFAFRKYSPITGVGDWVGFETFEKLFARRPFRQALSNNITIPFSNLFAAFRFQSSFP